MESVIDHWDCSAPHEQENAQIIKLDAQVGHSFTVIHEGMETWMVSVSLNWHARLERSCSGDLHCGKSEANGDAKEESREDEDIGPVCSCITWCQLFVYAKGQREKQKRSDEV